MKLLERAIAYANGGVCVSVIRSYFESFATAIHWSTPHTYRCQRQKRKTRRHVNPTQAMTSYCLFRVSRCSRVQRRRSSNVFLYLLLRLHVHRKSTRPWPTCDVGRTAFSASVYMFTRTVRSVIGSYLGVTTRILQSSTIRH